MSHFYKLVEGTKLYCDPDGNVLKNEDGETQAVPETDGKAVNVDEVDGEVKELLTQAYNKAIAEGETKASEAIARAEEALTKWFDAVAEKANAARPNVDVNPDEQKASFDVDSVMKGINKLAEKREQGTVSFNFKSENDLEMLAKSTSRNDLTGDVILPERDPEITRDPVRSPFMQEISDVQPINSDKAEWTEVVTETGAPATTAELATIPKKDYTFQVFSADVEKVGVMNRHSKELLKYGPQLVAAIRNMLRVDLQLEIDEQLLSGNGTTPNLQGVLGVAAALDAAAIGTQTTPDPQIFDVLRIAGTKVATAGKGKFVPNFVVLNPEDTERFDLKKDANNNYVKAPFYDPATRRFLTARVIENTGIAAGTFLMGDFNYLHVRPNGGIEIDMTNSHGTDFENDIIAMKMTAFLSAYVKNNENGAFITGDIDTAITELTPV